MISRRARIVVCVIGLAVSLQTVALPAPRTLIKMATLAPDGSAWDKALKALGSDWQRVTEGEVALRIYPGGTAGDEADVVRKMRIGQLDAAGISVVGLTQIDAAFEAFGIPLLFDSYEELQGVLEIVEPYFVDKLEAQGFVFLNWAHGGWAHLFSSNPVRSIEDLRRVKIFVTAGDDKRVQWWKDNGFQPRALAATDILTGLQTGMIDAMVTTPLITMSMQWYRRVPYMHNLALGPVVGATIMTRRAWNRLPESDRQPLIAAAREMEREIFERISTDDVQAVDLMKERGLEIVESRDEGEWRRQIERFAREMRGDMVPAEAFDRMIEARDEVRASLSGGAS